MSFDEITRSLLDRADEVEKMDGTIKYSYVTQLDDVKNFTSASMRKLIVLFSVIVLAAAILLTIGIAYNNYLMIALGAGGATIVLVLGLTVILSGYKTKNFHAAQVELCFNVYGVVMRVADKSRVSLFVYAWNDFDSIIEYSKVTVGLKDGMAYIFPKRLFSEQEFETFKRFSFASAGKKCMYKNFKP